MAARGEGWGASGALQRPQYTVRLGRHKSTNDVVSPRFFTHRFTEILRPHRTVPEREVNKGGGGKGEWREREIPGAFRAGQPGTTRLAVITERGHQRPGVTCLCQHPPPPFPTIPGVTLRGWRDVKIQQLTNSLHVSRFGLAVRR